MDVNVLEEPELHSDGHQRIMFCIFRTKFSDHLRFDSIPLGFPFLGRIFFQRDLQLESFIHLNAKMELACQLLYGDEVKKDSGFEILNSLSTYYS